jgi:hypothetical protein
MAAGSGPWCPIQTRSPLRHGRACHDHPRVFLLLFGKAMKKKEKRGSRNKSGMTGEDEADTGISRS